MRAVAIFLCLCAFGCTPLRYVTQAAAGQAELLDGKRDIDDIVRSGDFDARTRGLLSKVAGIKAFGERHGLKATKNYGTYVNLHRQAVVWVVSASAPLAFESKAWSFPITGSITYLGYFKRPEADAFAADLRTQKAPTGDLWDVDVRGASAYSTLGWFDDPVLSTMIYPGDEALGELADVILHESLHATYFVPGQSILNESVAAFVGNHLAETYLDETTGVCSREKRSYVSLEADGAARARAMKSAYFELKAVYATTQPDAQKLATKAEILQRLRSTTHIWRVINNATLIQYETYGSGDAELTALLRSCSGSWPRFLRTLESWRPQFHSASAHEDPALLLRPLLPRGCAR
jgi:predicted aminopeptidase